MINKNEWLKFLHKLHNKVRNAKRIKLTGMSALNEISNFLMFWYIEPQIEKHGLSKEYKFSYIHDMYASKKAIDEDKKIPLLEDKNSYKLWNHVYNVKNKECLIVRLLDNDHFKKYIISDVNKVSSYIGESGVCETVQEIFSIIYDDLKDVELNYEFFDAFGSAYEQFKTDSVSNAGKRTGQHFTPVSIKEFIIKELKLKPDDILYEPFAGSGGFLHTADNYIYHNFSEKEYEKFKHNIIANECEPEIIKSLMINMLLYDIPIDNIQKEDSFDINNCLKHKNKITKIATNPPFGMKVELTDHDYWEPLKSGKNIVKDSTAQALVHIYHSLCDGGVAGIVIDRGILTNGTEKETTWQSKLRKFLVENCNIYKIVLLPTGIFDYTNFATAIIFFKKEGKTEEIAFYEGKLINENKKQQLKIVEPIKVLKYGDIVKAKYSLKFDTLQENKNNCGSIKLNDICSLERGKPIALKDIEIGPYPVIGGGREPMGYHTKYNRFENTILISQSGSYAGYVSRYNRKIWASDCFSVTSSTYDNGYIYYFLKINQQKIYTLQCGQGQPHVYVKDVGKILIPTLPIEHQQEIVNFLDEQFKNYDINKLCDQINDVPLFNLLIKKQYDDFADVLYLIYRKIELIEQYNKYEMDKKSTFRWLIKCIKTEDKILGNLVKINIGGTPSRTKIEYFENGTFLWCKCSDINKGIVYDTDEKITQLGIDNSSVKLIKKGSIMMVFKLSTMGLIGIAGNDMYCNEAIMFFKHDNEITNLYLKLYLANMNIKKYATGQISDGNLNLEKLKQLPIKLPSLEEQGKIIQKIKLIEENQCKIKKYSDNTHQMIIKIFDCIKKITNEPQPKVLIPKINEDIDNTLFSENLKPLLDSTTKYFEEITSKFKETCSKHNNNIDELDSLDNKETKKSKLILVKGKNNKNSKCTYG